MYNLSTLLPEPVGDLWRRAVDSWTNRCQEEVVNSIRVMNYGLKRLQGLPLCLRLIREIHSDLLQRVRGAQ